MKAFLITLGAVLVVGFLILESFFITCCPPEVSPRRRCMQKLKVIGLALHAYHDTYGSFPPAYTVDETGRPAHSWRVLILPYLDEEALYSEYRFDEPWDGPHNRTLQDQIPDVYRCPSFHAYQAEHGLESPHSDRLNNYVAIEAAGAILDGPHPNTFNSVTDEQSSTLMVADVRQHAVHWMQPEDVSPEELLSDLLFSKAEGQGNHREGLLMLLADGSIRPLCRL